jgi:hypothetical protein
LRWFLLVVPLAIALLIVFRRRTGRPVVQALVLVAIGGIAQAAWPAPFPVDAAVTVAVGAALLWLFRDYFRP